MGEIRKQVDLIVKRGLMAHWASSQISLAVGDLIAGLEAELAKAKERVKACEMVTEVLGKSGDQQAHRIAELEAELAKAKDENQELRNQIGAYIISSEANRDETIRGI